MVGADHTDAPAGPHSCTPSWFLRVRLGFCGMVYACQSFLPVAASSATTLPRKVQHEYFGSAPVTSSAEETGTYGRLSCNTGAPVTRATGWRSSRAVHKCPPVLASTAWTLAATSPK